MSKDEHLHYLKVLKDNSSHLQPEVRDAIDYCIKMFSNNDDVYIKNRKILLVKIKKLFIARGSINKELSKLRKELNNLDNMIL